MLNAILKRLKNETEDSKNESGFRIFETHYYKVYKMVHRITGTWPYQSTLKHFIVLVAEMVVGGFALPGLVRSLTMKLI